MQNNSDHLAGGAGGGVLVQPQRVRCGDCAHFVRDGRCRYLETPEGRAKDRPFGHAPFWVWSDCYSDKEQVRAGVETLCPTFSAKAQGGAA